MWERLDPKVIPYRKPCCLVRPACTCLATEARREGEVTFYYCAEHATEADAERNAASTNVPTAFISFSGLLGPLWKGYITKHDLATGLFFFGTSKCRVMEKPPTLAHYKANRGFYESGEYSGAFQEWLNYSRYTDDEIEKLYAIIDMAQNAVRRAEENGRCSWWDRDPYTQWPQFVALLRQNGIDTTGWEEDRAYWECHCFNLGAVADALQGKVRCIWGGTTF